jgi:hypothetical protein
MQVVKLSAVISKICLLMQKNINELFSLGETWKNKISRIQNQTKSKTNADLFVVTSLDEVACKDYILDLLIIMYYDLFYKKYMKSIFYIKNVWYFESTSWNPLKSKYQAKYSN